MRSIFEQQSIQSLRLSVRTTNCLLKIGIIQIGDLKHFNPEEILNVRGAGRKVFAELVEVQKKLGNFQFKKSYASNSSDQKNSIKRISIDIRNAPEGALVKLLRPINEVEMTVRTRRIAGLLGVKRIGDFVKLESRQILTIEGAGTKTVKEIETILASLGFLMPTELINWTDEEINRLAKKFAKETTIDISNAPEGTLVKLLRPLSDFELSFRSRRIAKALGVKRIGDLVKLEPRQILAVKGAGRKTVKEIQTILTSLGITMPMNLINWTDQEVERLAKKYARKTDGIRRREISAQLKQFASGAENLNSLIDFLLAPIKNVRNREIIRSYQGWSGAEARTLQEVADIYKLTRERVRQLNAKFENSIKLKGIKTDLVDLAVDQIKKACPCLANKALEAVINGGLVSPGVSLTGIFNLAQLFGVDTTKSFTFEKADSGETLVFLNSRASLGDILSAARKGARSDGVGTLEEVASLLKERHDVEMGTSEIRKVLRCFNEFEWLDSEYEWFWLRERKENRNRLVNFISKIMAVTPDIQLGDLREGVQRNHRTGGFAPPRRVLGEVCKRLDFCRVDGDIVYRVKELDPAVELSPLENVMFKILQKNGGVIDRHQFYRECCAQGIKDSSFNIYLGYSPIIKRIAEGVYGYRGVKTSPGVIADLSSRMGRRAGRVLKDHGWTSKGSPWLSYKLSNGMLQGGVCSLPSGLRGMIQGDFNIHSEDGAILCKMTFRGNQGWGLKPFFRRRGGEEGDSLLLVFDLGSKSIRTRLGGDEIADDVDVAEVTEALPEELPLEG